MSEIVHLEPEAAAAPKPPASPVAPKLDRELLQSTERFFNRELSWLRFNERVLEESENKRHPILERLRFLSISASNLDEFYMVRIAGLKGQVREGVRVVSQDGLSPAEQLTRVSAAATELMNAQGRIWRTLRGELAREKLHVVELGGVTPADRATLEPVFTSQVFPVLTPVGRRSGPSLPVPAQPRLRPGAEAETGQRRQDLLRARTNAQRACAGSGSSAPARRASRSTAERRYVPVETLVALFLDRLFPECEVQAQGVFQIIRDSDVEIEEEAEDLVREFEALLRQRRRGSVVRIALEAAIAARVAGPDPASNLQLPSGGGGRHPGAARPVSAFRTDSARSRGLEVYSLRAALPRAGAGAWRRLFSRRSMRRTSWSTTPTRALMWWCSSCAKPPPIRTCWRSSRPSTAPRHDSPIVAALIDAADRGKNVTALVEIKARFDEANNLKWARDLKRAGVHVVFGFIEYKTHAKISVVVRKEGEALRTYCHFGTGNYHPVTAKIYTDLSLFTCDRDARQRRVQGVQLHYRLRSA